MNTTNTTNTTNTKQVLNNFSNLYNVLKKSLSTTVRLDNFTLINLGRLGYRIRNKNNRTIFSEIANSYKTDNHQKINQYSRPYVELNNNKISVQSYEHNLSEIIDINDFEDLRFQYSTYIPEEYMICIECLLHLNKNEDHSAYYTNVIYADTVLDFLLT